MNNALDAAHAFIDQYFPECTAAFLAGSVLRGEATATSDLDIVIVTTREGVPYRESLIAFGWPIEAFVHNTNSLRAYFASDARERTPALPVMCSEGIILQDQDGTAQQIKEEALMLLERGPERLNADEITNLRYRITDVLDDFTGIVTPGENYLAAAGLAEVATELLLSYNHQWIGQGKWLIRALKRFDEGKAQQLIAALERFYLQGSKDELIRFAEQALEPVGGRLFEGYKSAGSVHPSGNGM